MAHPPPDMLRRKVRKHLAAAQGGERLREREGSEVAMLSLCWLLAEGGSGVKQITIAKKRGLIIVLVPCK